VYELIDVALRVRHTNYLEHPDTLMAWEAQADWAEIEDLDETASFSSRAHGYYFHPNNYDFGAFDEISSDVALYAEIYEVMPQLQSTNERLVEKVIILDHVDQISVSPDLQGLFIRETMALLTRDLIFGTTIVFGTPRPDEAFWDGLLPLKSFPAEDLPAGTRASGARQRLGLPDPTDLKGGRVVWMATSNEIVDPWGLRDRRPN
jgi:hypothetical protein